MNFSAEYILNRLTLMTPQKTSNAPRGERGIYGLIDHNGVLGYIGSTHVANEDFYKRIHCRHRTGSEEMSNYFSHMYNTGRMWRERRNQLEAADGLIAKKLRNAFIADHCRAVWCTILENEKITKLEQEVIRLAAKENTVWNGRKAEIYDEPSELVDQTLRALKFTIDEQAAVDRQRERFHAKAGTVQRRSPVQFSAFDEFPIGPFRFAALDVETAIGNRASICQIGIAFVRRDNTIVTWKSFVDPRVGNNWAFTPIHGITPQMVSGAPTFAQLLPVLRTALDGIPVYQHSQFDRSAVNAVCSRDGLDAPVWIWRDSILVARSAWPELRGNGGHGLANLKTFLGLEFQHHDAGEDARAAAEIVILAEQMDDETSNERFISQRSGAKPNGFVQAPVERLTWIDSDKNICFSMVAENARAYGRVTDGAFTVLKGSTAMKDGSPKIKRNRALRDSLVQRGILVEDTDPKLYRFSVDYEFTSKSAAGGVIKDGNCSGNQAWREKRG